MTVHITLCKATQHLVLFATLPNVILTFENFIVSGKIKYYSNDSECCAASTKDANDGSEN